MNTNNEYNKAVAELNEEIIKFLIKLYDNGRFEALSHMGVSKDDVNSFCRLEVGSLRNLGNYPTLIADFKFNSQRARHLVDHIKCETDKNFKLTRLIELGASHTMMEALVGMDRDEVKKRKCQLGITEDGRGRPHTLTDHEVNMVNEILRANKDIDQIDLYTIIGSETGVPLSSVWQYNQNMDIQDAI